MIETEERPLHRCPVCTFSLSRVRHDATSHELCGRCGGGFIEERGLRNAFGGLGDPSRWPADEVQVWMVILLMRVKLSDLSRRMAALQVGSAAAGVPGVAWYAHVGGFAVALLLGWRFRNHLRIAVPA